MTSNNRWFSREARDRESGISILSQYISKSAYWWCNVPLKGRVFFFLANSHNRRVEHGHTAPDLWRAPGGLGCVARWWRLRVRRKCDTDRLIAQFHALFRQIEQEKQQRP